MQLPAWDSPFRKTTELHYWDEDKFIPQWPSSMTLAFFSSFKFCEYIYGLHIWSLPPPTKLFPSKSSSLHSLLLLLLSALGPTVLNYGCLHMQGWLTRNMATSPEQALTTYSPLGGRCHESTSFTMECWCGLSFSKLLLIPLSPQDRVLLGSPKSLVPRDRVLLGSPGWPKTPYVDQIGIKVTESHLPPKRQD